MVQARAGGGVHVGGAPPQEGETSGALNLDTSAVSFFRKALGAGGAPTLLTGTVFLAFLLPASPVLCKAPVQSGVAATLGDLLQVTTLLQVSWTSMPCCFEPKRCCAARTHKDQTSRQAGARFLLKSCQGCAAQLIGPARDRSQYQSVSTGKVSVACTEVRTLLHRREQVLLCLQPGQLQPLLHVTQNDISSCSSFRALFHAAHYPLRRQCLSWVTCLQGALRGTVSVLVKAVAWREAGRSLNRAHAASWLV